MWETDGSALTPSQAQKFQTYMEGAFSLGNCPIEHEQVCRNTLTIHNQIPTKEKPLKKKCILILNLGFFMQEF